MTRHVFFAEVAALASAVPGGIVELTGAEARHAATVKRMAPGEQLDVVDGAGRRVSAEAEQVSAALIRLRVSAVADEEPPTHRITLVQALAKGDRSELAVEAATELGIDAVIPWEADRSIVRWRGEKSARGVAKWQAVVRSATKQSRRAWIPSVSDAVDSHELSRWVTDQNLAIVLHEDATIPLARRVRDMAFGQFPPGKDALPVGSAAAKDSVKEIALIVGPEGGITDGEIAALKKAGAVTAVLGNYVLRSSTAGPAALSVLSQLLGRWED